MLISRVKINGILSWIEKAEDSYFLLSGDAYQNNLTREKEIQVNESEILIRDLFQPVSVFGLAYNYKSLVNQSENFEDPLIFLKSVNSISNGYGVFNYPPQLKKIWAECELVIVIKKNCKNITTAEAPDYILGYTIGSDITAENNYGRDHHLALSKAGDGFAPLYRWINTDLNNGDLKIKTEINGDLFQEDTTGNRIWDDSQAVASLSQNFTLHPGDIIFTGTPAGAIDSIIDKGDKVEHYIENIGTLSFSVK